jgi:diketogulonate reductase-like aldo/keto reductase
VQGVHSVAFSPLGHRKDNELMTHPAVQQVAAETGRSPAAVLLKWNVQRGVAVIPKAGSEPHLRENIEGLFSWRLTWDQKAKLDAIDCGKRFVDNEWHTWDDAEEGGAAKPSLVL